MGMNRRTMTLVSPEVLAPGQLWKLKHAYVQIVETGKRLVSYRMMRSAGETWVKAKWSDVETLWGYLQSRHARLVQRRITRSKGFSSLSPQTAGT
jgi:hypothetical protein